MITIQKGGITRITSLDAFVRKFKSQGYLVVEEVETKPLQDDIEPKELEDDEIDIEIYAKGNGWYELDGKSYRKADLLERLVD